jgi:glycosyltransferase involved in cell wall biosynthesis
MVLSNSVESALTLIRRDVNKTLLAQVDFMTHKDQLGERSISLYMPFECADDPKIAHLGDNWNKYNAIVFQSHWQQSMYNLFLGIPYSAGIVMPNAITSIQTHKKDDNAINLLFVGDPRNGLDIVFSAFKRLSPKNPNVMLYVFSDFSVLGNLKDKVNKHLATFYDDVRSHPNVIFNSDEAGYSGMTKRVSVFEKCHVLVSPSKFPDASPIPLLECMSAGMVCIHSSYGSLPELTLGLTSMYGYSEDDTDHVNMLYLELDNIIRLFNRPGPRKIIANKLAKDKAAVDEMYSWEKRCIQWNDFLLNQLTHR